MGVSRQPLPDLCRCLRPCAAEGPLRVSLKGARRARLPRSWVSGAAAAGTSGVHRVMCAGGWAPRSDRAVLLQPEAQHLQQQTG
jgi:hypothetical protein